MTRDTILYIGNFGIPNRNAAGSRVLANGYIFREMGYNVMFLGTAEKNTNPQPLSETYKLHHGFECFEFPNLKHGLNSIKYLKLFNEFISLIKARGLEKNIKAIIFYGSPTVSLWVSKVINWCKKNGILAIEDCVDWLEINHGNEIFKLAKRFDYYYRKAYLNKKMDGVICISEYLQDYYSDKGMSTVLIPPLTLREAGNLEIDYTKTDLIRIVYAGVPFPLGKLEKREHAKDRLDLVIKYFYILYKEGYRFKFDIYGISMSQYLQVLPEDEHMLNELKELITFYGYQESKIVKEKISRSDFTILLRDINRGTTAGFSTKFVHSISCGTPVITTNTSDISNYMKEGIYGFIVDNEEKKAVSKLRSILLLSREEIASMKQNCKASEMFFYKRYINQMNDFMMKIEK